MTLLMTRALKITDTWKLAPTECKLTVNESEEHRSQEGCAS